jgi:ABC-type multidrug transport system permease subunit
MHGCVIIALGLLISALAPNVDAAAALMPLFLIIGVLFGGFYIKITSLPPVLNLVPYVSSFKWGFEALCINEFKGETFLCDPDAPANQCQRTGEEVLKTLSFDGD